MILQLCLGGAKDLGSRVQDSLGLGLLVWGFELRIEDFRFRVKGLGFGELRDRHQDIQEL